MTIEEFEKNVSYSSFPVIVEADYSKAIMFLYQDSIVGLFSKENLELLISTKSSNREKIFMIESSKRYHEDIDILNIDHNNFGHLSRDFIARNFSEEELAKIDFVHNNNNRTNNGCSENCGEQSNF